MLLFRNILFFFLMLSCLNCGRNNKNPECGLFRTGRFMIHSPGTDTIIIFRTEDRQFERNRKTGDRFEFKVNWISDCEHELIRADARGPEKPGIREAIMYSIIGLPTYIKIKEVRISFYVFDMWKKGIDRKYRDTMWVIK